MVDLTRDAEKVRARKALKRAVLLAVAAVDLQEQCSILIEALTDVEDMLNESTGSTNKTTSIAESKSAEAKRGSAGDDADATGPTELILAILEDAAPKSMKAVAIIAEARRRCPDITPNQIHQALSRMHTASESKIVRRGSKGAYKYALRSPSIALEPTTPPDSEATQVGQIVELLKSQPTSDYGVLAMKVYGTSDSDSKSKVRNNIYYLKRQQRVVRRDGKWEVASTG
jgi:hypothetical protein